MNWETIEHPVDGSTMVLVPEGPFLMGLPANDSLGEEHEKPQRLVDLAAYWIDVYPVSNARFSRFLAAGGYEEARWWDPLGWAWKCQHRIRQPLKWGHAGWDGN